MAFGGVFHPVFRPVFDPGGAVAAPPAVNWWEAGGAPTPVAVYQPKGAASQAASYVNLANPGTYDAALGVAPSWASGTGWVFSGTEYLLTGVPAGAGMTLVARFSGVMAPTAWRPVLGDQSAFPRLVLWPSGSGCTYDAGGTLSVNPYLAAGVLAVAGQQGYRDGVADGGTIATATGTWGTIRIGMVDGYGAGFVGNVQLVAVYSDTLDATEMADLYTAMIAI